MKQKILIIGIIVLASLALAVIFLYPEINQPPKPTDFMDVVIIMERSPCYGFCPAYSLTIYGDGTVIYEGKMSVNVTGKRTSKISQNKVKELVDEFYRINYFSLKDKYDRPITDIPHTITSIKINGKYKSVYNRAGGPRELNELENKIDEVTNSKQWVKGE
ncbi:MAG: hypothetical protein B6U72_06505 [Candidatus Altiarchaeales archaeon ex4484_2]|nr:MAG: hypothetical protein B6U72_06505 [Candidatus Altiarchaeales archaeon ex4484_2]